MLTAEAVTARQYHDANTKIVVMYGYLDELINVLDGAHVKGQELLNPRDLFPMADKMIRAISEAIYAIHQAYAGYVKQNFRATGEQVKLIEREMLRIFREVKDVVSEAKKLDVHPITNHLERIEDAWNIQAQQNHHNLSQYAQGGKRTYYNELRVKRGPIQTALFEEARRLGPQYGSHFLLGIEDVFLGAIDMFHAIRDTGFGIDLKHVPDTETTMHTWLEPEAAKMAPENSEFDANIGALYSMMQQCRAYALNAWATAKN